MLKILLVLIALILLAASIILSLMVSYSCISYSLAARKAIKNRIHTLPAQNVEDLNIQHNRMRIEKKRLAKSFIMTLIASFLFFLSNQI